MGGRYVRCAILGARDGIYFLCIWNSIDFLMYSITISSDVRESLLAPSTNDHKDTLQLCRGRGHGILVEVHRCAQWLN